MKYNKNNTNAMNNQNLLFNENNGFKMSFDLLNFSEVIYINIDYFSFDLCNIKDEELAKKIKSIVFNHVKVDQIKNKIAFAEHLNEMSLFIRVSSSKMFKIEDFIDFLMDFGDEELPFKSYEIIKGFKENIEGEGYFITLKKKPFDLSS